MLRGTATMTVWRQPATSRGVPWIRQGVTSARLRDHAMTAMRWTASPADEAR